MYARCTTDHDFHLQRGDDPEAQQTPRREPAPDTIFDEREWHEPPATVGMSYATYQRLQAEKLAAREQAVAA